MDFQMISSAHGRLRDPAKVTSGHRADTDYFPFMDYAKSEPARRALRALPAARLSKEHRRM